MAKTNNKPAQTKQEPQKTQAEQSDQKQEPQKTQIVVVTFLQPYQCYSKDDIAGFDAKTAEHILALEPAVAERYQPDEATGE